jgi:hypothetical protein
MLHTPTIFIPLGEIAYYRNKSYRAIPRPDANQLRPENACDGCAFKSGDCGILQCSRFDRKDKTDVWFEAVETA